MRVLVDATPLLGARTGVGQFTALLLDALRSRDDVDVGTFSVSWRAGSVRLPARVLHEVWRRVDWPSVTGRADVVHGTNYVVPPTRRSARSARVATVHDLTVLRFPHLVAPATRAYPDLVRRAVGAGAWVHTPSAFVAAEVVEAFGVDPTRVRSIPHAVVPAPVEDVRAAHDFPYVLAIGTVEPRKDLPTLVRAFDKLASSHPDLRLVVAGGDGWAGGVQAFDAAVAAASHRDRVVRHGYVGERERSALLRGASLFAFPSLYEGFGMPPLEAMAAGVPVVAARAGGVPEAVGDAAVLVEPGRPDDWAEAMAEVLADEDVRAGLVARGRARAAARTWNDVAAEMTALYRDAAACAS
ncbi:MAG: hypothetical protein QOI20_1383 [Acidimicrobiaceae bacterium]|jgi:glycosyltransferase involved in cell wall biosynthesis|nr:hypothetical protein [Acidimicrobiaceae bacterium]